MSNFFKNDFKRSLDTGFIDHNIESEVLYRPKLLVNKQIPKEKVLSTLLQELTFCEEFYISVAFVTTSGIAVLLNTLLELEQKGIKGKVLVSQYLNFTQPEALKKLLNFQNIELKISTKNNSHSKGYIFKTQDYYNIIVGSSNWTASALTTNKEWNLKVSGLYSSEIVNNVLLEFEADFHEAISVTKEYISGYEIIYEKARISKHVIPEGNKEEDIAPNIMQSEALHNLENIRLKQKTKALIISATGTGKTHLSTFDVQAFKPKKLLFVVHRLNIAQKALETFQKIFKNTKSFGLYSGQKRELDADFVFSTIQTISREDHLSKFKKEHFDYIIIDESHRSGADSYLRLIEHFNPKFLLGMTATPERTDGNDIFSLFDHNIAYEIRLNKAMEEGMLSQFHYFGITDLKVNDELLENTKDFNLLAADERVEKIIEKAQLYGSDNGITRGLVFCSRNTEAKFLSEKFNKNGFKTTALSGDNSESERVEAIRCLESDNINEKIDYIFTVDIFNEGIDIPKVNQILMIRPTESAIIFVQQLGRGLRKSNGKDYLTIVDFIGNHKNNYLIPVALYGDTSYNKDTLRKLISEGSKMLPGSSTINFDKITKEKIFKSIDSANMKILSDLKKDYSLLKYRLGRMPMMVDFLSNETREPYLFVEYSKSYYNFVAKVDKDFKPVLNKEFINLLELFSREINNSKRVEESYILKELLLNRELKLEEFREKINLKYGYYPSSETIKSCLENLNFEFIRKEKNIIILRDGTFMFHEDFLEYIKRNDFKKFLLDSVNYSINSFDKNYKKEYFKNGLILFNKYSRKDVCRLLNWDKDVSSTVYGYRTNKNVTPCFVTYHKSHEIDDSINYNDYFVNPSIFAWESRSNRKLESNEIQSVINSNRILLFVKKGDGEGTDFYFMGDCSIITNSIEQAIMPDSQKPIVHFKFQLEQPVTENLYQYITSNNSVDIIEEEPQIKKTFTIPFYDFYAAAGNFSDLQSEKTFSQIEVPEKYAINTDYFACKVIGESMNKRIQNGSICIFKKYAGGSRSNKILLIENRDIQDPDFNSAFTVKTYASQKSVTEEGWEHLEILLKPNSFDSSYKDIVINEGNANEMNVIGEFISVLK
jgi:superfamily II DNA or RNA helicase